MSDCVDHNKLWKIPKEIGIPDHLIFPSIYIYNNYELYICEMYVCLYHIVPACTQSSFTGLPSHLQHMSTPIAL